MPLPDWFDRFGGVTPIEGNLLRSPLPYTRDHWSRVKASGVKVVFSMAEETPGDLAREAGLDWRPHFWTDDEPPKVEEMDRFLEDYRSVPADVPVLVHCKAGWGRTGSAVACALVATRGLAADEALARFWRRVPPARDVMTANLQAEFVRGYAARLRGRGL